MDGDLIFCSFWRRAPFLGTSVDINEYSGYWLRRCIISLHRDPVGEHRGDFLTRTLGERELLEMGGLIFLGARGY
jgi:hypothetical protein